MTTTLPTALPDKILSYALGTLSMLYVESTTGFTDPYAWVNKVKSITRQASVPVSIMAVISSRSLRTACARIVL